MTSSCCRGPRGANRPARSAGRRFGGPPPPAAARAFGGKAGNEAWNWYSPRVSTGNRKADGCEAD